MSLHRTELGASGPRVVFCHGLFGQGKNWTQAAKALSTDHRVLLLDMPNHGRSPWTETFDFLELADLVAAEIGDEPASAMTQRARSSIDSSCGLPMLTGPGWSLPTRARMPTTRSST